MKYTELLFSRGVTPSFFVDSVMGFRSLTKLFSGHGLQSPSPQWTSRADVLLLAAADNASIAYLIEPYLGSQRQTSLRIDMNANVVYDLAHADCRVIVIVRYLPKTWIKTLRDCKRAGKRIVYFMDDDLMDPSATAGLPLLYAKKIRSNATLQRRVLEELCDEFWVATAFLADKYTSWAPLVLTPRPAARHVAPRESVNVCYHGSASHKAELEWLVPVVRNVQMATGSTHFEVFGDHAVNRLYRDVLRTSVLHPMAWPNYLEYTAAVSRDIGLAPLLPNRFNAGRGPTKFFDFARMGAVGIYTDVAPYRDFIRDGVDGVLLPNDPALWAREIRELTVDETRRKCMAQSAYERAASLAWDQAVAA